MERVVPFLADTSGPFEQLLDAEQTAQSVQAWIQKKKNAIRTIKKQAIDQDIPRNDVYGDIKQLEQDIGRFKQLLKSNEASRNNWRKLHMAAWRATIRPLKVVDLPNEVLATIFANFEDVPVPKIQVDDARVDDFPFPSPDVASIKNIRLTCRAFCNVGSMFLLPLVDVSFTPASIQRLEKISNQPTISQGVRIIRIYTGTYNSRLVDRVAFCNETIYKLVNLQQEFEFEKVQVEEEVKEACHMIGIPVKPKYLKIGGFQIALEEADDVLETLMYQTRHNDRPVAPHNRFETKISKAITQAHEEYQRRYLDQKSLIGDCHVHDNIQAAVRRMPCVRRLCLTNSSVRRFDDSIRSGWDQRLDAQKYKAILRSPNPFRKLMIDSRVDDFQITSRIPELALWFRIPLLFDVGEGNLTHLDISIVAFDGTHIDALSRHIQSVRRACQQLRRVQIKITPRYGPFDTGRTRSAFVAETCDVLDAILSSPRLEAVTLDLMFRNRYHDANSVSSFGVMLGNLPWRNLRRVRLLFLPIKIGELRQALEKVPGKVHLDLDGINLSEGTWAEALEILRGKADSSSLVCQPQGVEFVNISPQEEGRLRYKFDSEHSDGWYSAQRCPGLASFYIRGGNIPNPLIWDSD
ncbi:hypothetical protein SLS64_011515 [Diaporthe eres]